MSPRLSTSTWSLHRALGITYPDSPGSPNIGAVETYGSGSITLQEVPARIAAMGIRTLEICHFHLPSREKSYLDELRGALDSAGVELWSLLVDDGDVTHPQHGPRDQQWIAGWIETAGLLGAKHARVIAGKSSPTPENLERSRQALADLAEHGKRVGVSVMTENWFGLLSTPGAVKHLLASVDVGLCADFGNWSGATKYDDLAAIFPLAESCHAKCSFPAPEQPNREDYERCLHLSRKADFDGPYTLIYDGPGDDEWRGLAIEIEIVSPYLSG
jgi:sugar phosphate isomerase/epimerase